MDSTRFSLLIVIALFMAREPVSGNPSGGGFPSATSGVLSFQEDGVGAWGGRGPRIAGGTASGLLDTATNHMKLIQTLDPFLGTAEAVRRLTAEQAERRQPVRLRGVITYLDADRFYRFIDDGTAGIYFHTEGAAELVPLAAGQLVELEGVTDKGEFAPVIQARQAMVVGEGPFPPAHQVNFEQISTGQYDSQFIEVEGVVRSVRIAEPGGRFSLVVSIGGGRLEVLASGLPLRANEMVDSVVSLQGVCVTRFNRQRQLFDTGVLAQDVRIVKAAPSDPFAIPTQSISSLFRFTPQGVHGHRVLVRGTVTLCDGETLYLQDGEAGLYVETLDEGRLKPGEVVEVLGFPSPGDYSPMVKDAQFRRVGKGQPAIPASPVPLPELLTADAALKGAQDCRLVRMDAVVVDRSRNGGQMFLVLQANGVIFHAYLPRGMGERELAKVVNDSFVGVTGVCRIEPGRDWNAGADWRASSFRLMLRSGADIQVIRPASFWTLRRLLWATGGLTLVVLASFTWVAVLRRRVSRQTDIIRQKLETEAALKERYLELFENANDVVYTHDLQGRLTSVNQAGEQLLQHRREQLLGRNLVDLIAPAQQPAAAVWIRHLASDRTKTPGAGDVGALATNSTSGTVEWDFVSASGQSIRMEVGTRLICVKGRPNEVEGIARDITERKHLENELLEVSNREQRRIGHDLHDGVCQQLVGIAYMAETIGERLQEQNLPEASELERIRSFLQAAVAQTRGVARGLFPVRLEENGLISALEEWALHAGELFHIDCQFSCIRQPQVVDPATALHLYYIAQEAVGNAAKHGRASAVEVSIDSCQWSRKELEGVLSQDSQRVQGSISGQSRADNSTSKDPTRLENRSEAWILRVRDNGTGFDLRQRPTTGMGLKIMDYRARVIGATLEVASEPGSGTVVTCIWGGTLPPQNENF